MSPVKCPGFPALPDGSPQWLCSGSDRKGLLLYFSTSDIDASVARVGELGGSASAPSGIPGVGRYATCTDTEGNEFGLFQPEPAS